VGVLIARALRCDKGGRRRVLLLPSFLPSFLGSIMREKTKTKTKKKKRLALVVAIGTMRVLSAGEETANVVVAEASLPPLRRREVPLFAWKRRSRSIDLGCSSLVRA